MNPLMIDARKLLSDTRKFANLLRQRNKAIVYNFRHKRTGSGF